jgi:uncharacterized protein (DUF2342 family)
VTTLPVNKLPAHPPIPLSPEARAAYQDLYNKMQAAIDSTMDLATLQALNAWQPKVELVLTEDDNYKLNADTAVFDSLQEQINYVNQGLKTLRDQISSIASHIAVTGDILAAINKVLTLVPGV